MDQTARLTVEWTSMDGTERFQRSFEVVPGTEDDWQDVKDRIDLIVQEFTEALEDEYFEIEPDESINPPIA